MLSPNRPPSPSPASPDNTGLLIPYALDDAGHPVGPIGAPRTRALVCPECHRPVIVRRGAVVRPHFAHTATQDACPFHGEGTRHLLAKHALLLAIFQWKRCGTPAPVLQRTCDICGETHAQPLPPRVARARLEHRIPAGNPGAGLVPDVALLDTRDTIVAAVEIRHTHAVSTEKNSRFGTLPWIELDALEAIEDPTAWRPIAHGNLRPARCGCSRGRPLAVTARGNAYHVDACPLAPRLRLGRTFANVTLDCRECPYCIGVEKESGGRARARPLRVICRAPRR